METDKKPTVSQLLADALKANGIDAWYIGLHDAIQIRPSSDVRITIGYTGLTRGSVSRRGYDGISFEPDDANYPETGLPDGTEDVEALVREWTRIARQYGAK